jgi:hypothetical protein
MNVSVNGLGLVSRLGDQEDFKKLLESSCLIEASGLSAEPNLPIDIPTDMNISQQLLRRMSHFAKISLLSACKALKDSGLNLTGKPVGIIQGSVYGPIVSGLQAFDDLIDFGDNQLSPTNFSGSVFNTSATYLSLALGIQGPTLSHTSGMDTLYNSLLTASLWLEKGMTEYVIVGIGDEYTPYFDNGFLNGQPHSQDGLLPSCEGWTTLIVSNESQTKYGKIEFSPMETLPQKYNQNNIYSIWHEQLTPAFFFEHAKKNQSCFPEFLRGSYPSAAAFDVALALICNNYRRFPVSTPLSDDYQIFDLKENEPICCYSISESNKVFGYKAIKDY